MNSVRNMRISFTSRYERTISTLLFCFSVTSFALCILLLLNVFSNITGVIISLIAVVSSILVIRVFYYERRHEIFDITSPTQFEPGLLVFQSPMTRCAVFFAFHITLVNVKAALFQRSLTILLKILPTSTILALEWTSQRECFITFYIKLDKSSFLTHSRELLENISKSFNNTLGEQFVRLLNGEELRNHFSLGISGRFKKISVNGRYGIGIQTDAINIKRAFAILTLDSVDKLNTTLSQLDAIQDLHMILSFKKTENSIEMSKSFILVFNNPGRNDLIQMQQQKSAIINQIRASNVIQIFGDILTRNQIHEPQMELDYQQAANVIFTLLSTPWPTNTTPERYAETNQTHVSNTIVPLPWRQLLIEQLSNLKSSFQKDTLILVDRMPIRVDAQIDNTLFFVVPQAKEYRLKWLIQTIINLLEQDKTKSVILLLTQPQKNILSQARFSDLTKSRRIHLVVTKQELTELLQAKYEQLLKRQNGVPQVS